MRPAYQRSRQNSLARPHPFVPLIIRSPLADEIFEANLSEVFPGIELPTKAYSRKQSPDGSMFWIAGLRGEMKVVRLLRRVWILNAAAIVFGCVETIGCWLSFAASDHDTTSPKSVRV